LEELITAVPALGLQLISAPMRTSDDFERAFATMMQRRPNTFVMTADPLSQRHIMQIIDFMASHRLPAMYQLKENVMAGGLMAYGASLPVFVHVDNFADRQLIGVGLNPSLGGFDFIVQHLWIPDLSLFPKAAPFGCGSARFSHVLLPAGPSGTPPHLFLFEAVSSLSSYISGRSSGTLAVLPHEREVGVGAERKPLRCPPIKFLFAHRGVTSCQRARRNDGALAHDAAGSNEGTCANARPAQENCSHPDQAPPADVGTMQNRAMANRHTVFDNQSLGWGLCVGHDIILNVAVLSYSNRPKIRSQYSAKPNARVLPYLHIPDQNRIRCNKRAGGNARRASLELKNDWHVGSWVCCR
jgi:hypothetical protein